MRIRCLTLALSCLLTGLAAHFLSAADWPCWRGPRRDNISPDTGLLKSWPKDGPKLLWSASVVNKKKTVGVGYSSLSIAGGRIFTMGDIGKDGFVFAYERASGKELWATRISANLGDGPRCTPTVDGERVYALSPHGDLVCLGVQKGEIQWSKNYEKDFQGKMMSSWRFSESPLVDGDKLICTPGADEAALVALDKVSGNVIWKAKIPQCGGAAYSSPVIAEVGGVRQYLNLIGPGKNGGLVAVDANTGKFLWNYRRVANGTANIPTPLVKGDLVFTSTGYNTGAALLQMVPSGDGVRIVEKYWLNGRDELQNHHGGMVLVGDHVYGGHGHDDGQPFCLNLTKGTLAWGPIDPSPGRSAAVTFADGHLYFRFQNNMLALIEATPKEYRVKSQFRLPKEMSNPGWQHPVVLDGRLYVRGNYQLLCYDVKQK